jgi:hypothetical protein
MELIAEKQFPANYSQSVLQVFEAMSLSDLKGLKIVGSSSIRSQLYSGDFDAIETIKAESVGTIKSGLQDTVKKLRSIPLTSISEMKCGEIQEWDVFQPKARVEDGKVLDFNRVQSKSAVAELLAQKVLTHSEAADANDLLDAATDEWGFLHAKKTIRHHILRWTPLEILAGVKEVRGRTVLLEDAILSGGLIKTDAVSDINSRFTEFSVIHEVFIKGKRITQPPKPLVQGLTEDMLYFERINPFKALKRLFSLAKHFKETAVLEKLVPILNSDLGRLYQIVGDLKTLKSLLDGRRFPSERIEAILQQIDDVKMRIGNIYKLKDFLREEQQIDGELNALLKTPIPKLQPKLEKLIDRLETLLNEETMKQVGGLLKTKVVGR